MATRRAWLEQITQRMQRAGVYNPQAEARKIFCRALAFDKDALVYHLEGELSSDEEARLDALVRQREQRMPLDRIFGAVNFYDLTIQLGAGVFKPYPETEAMVEHALLACENTPGPLRVLDVGTGTGCILLAFLSQHAEASGLGIDINEGALALAQRNAEACGLEDRAAFQSCDWGNGLREKFDLVLCNPPRVRSADIPHLLPEMREHDPHSALDGGKDGLKFYRRLAEMLDRIAKPETLCFVQVGSRYAQPALRLFQRVGFRATSLLRNSMGHESCLVVRNVRSPSWIKTILPQLFR